MKGAIDSRIAEEQARQRTLQGSPSRSASNARRPLARASSPSVRNSSDGRGIDPPPKGPDPSEFDPEFVVGDEEGLSRTGTPQPPRAKEAEAVGKSADNEASGVTGEGEKQREDGADITAQTAPTELPADVLEKIRKLERLEPKYKGKRFRNSD